MSFIVPGTVKVKYKRNRITICPVWLLKHGVCAVTPHCGAHVGATHGLDLSLLRPPLLYLPRQAPLAESRTTMIKTRAERRRNRMLKMILCRVRGIGVFK